MYLDITYFGYGVGLVMAAWFFGMVIGSVFRAIRSVWYFSFILIPFFAFPSVSVADVFDCYTLSTAFITHENKAGDWLEVNGAVTRIIGNVQQSVSCKGQLTVDCSDGDFVVAISTVERFAPKRIQEYSILVSLFVGSLAAIAFVLAISQMDRAHL